MKERWTEAEVSALPAGEHNYFDRKSGAILDKGGLLNDLAKAMSAFANSGGGSLVLGVADDGSFDGCKMVFSGKARTRDWLEQRIPALVDPPLSNFRVHEVEPSHPSKIPTGSCLIAVDVGDSVNAPHQVEGTGTYFHRAGGRSEPASHFYLEAIRNRLIAPLLSITHSGTRVLWVRKKDTGITVFGQFLFSLKNDGRVPAPQWMVGLSTEGPAEHACKLNVNPPASSAFDETGLSTSPILPTRTTVAVRSFRLELPVMEESQVAAEVGAILSAVRITAESISQHGVSRRIDLDPTALLDAVSEPAIRFAWPSLGLRFREQQQGRIYAANGVHCLLQCEEIEDYDGHIHVVINLQNDGDADIQNARILLCFTDEGGSILHLESFSVAYLPRMAKHSQRRLVTVRDIINATRVEVICVFLPKSWRADS